ncbi:SRPBCC family protein [Candidatus Methylocalor cossyra]|uniref:Polyketide cyclase / dehydrase and lipid transport n=1 Tax=Candidatus Methylocalor cossyra TaxID=3108543 RepID=A0ABM9NJU0_9GAMM
MTETVIVTKVIKVPADRVWTAISGIGGLERWFPVIARCRVEGEGVGAVRVLELTGGGEIRDRIERIDHGARRFHYLRTDHPFPVTRYVGTVEVGDGGDGQAEVAWSVEIDVTAEARDEMVGFLKGALSDGIDGIERDLQGA